LDGGELADQLSRVDAVVTTPSTAMLEAMILGRPVGCLDYHNVPRFVPTAWTISAREHIAGVVAELLAPSPAKMAFQRECLRDTLLCDGSAATRVAKLIEKVAIGANRAKRNGLTLRRMARAGKPSNDGSTVLFPSLASLYPDSPVFQEHDVRSLQVRLARAETENARLTRQQLDRGIGYWVQAAGRETARRMKARYRQDRS